MEGPGHVLMVGSMPELKSNSIIFSTFFTFLLPFTDFYLVVRSQRSVGLVGELPTYDLVEAFQAPDTPARTYQYSPDGRLFALAVPSGCVGLQCLWICASYARISSVRVHQAETAVLLHELTIPDVVELSFSPRGTYLSTWERHVKLGDGSQHKNLRIFAVSTGKELISFSQKALDAWDVQYTISESQAIRLVGSEIQVFNPAEWEKGVVDRLKVKGSTSDQPLLCSVLASIPQSLSLSPKGRVNPRAFASMPCST